MECCVFRAKHMDLFLISSRHALLLALIFTCLYEPSLAFPTTDLQHSFTFTKQPEAGSTTDRQKRVAMLVDTWSLCPPEMENVDCFYTYLRVYARLRKAARETDQVSMRNIGKRSIAISIPELKNIKRTLPKYTVIKRDRQIPMSQFILMALNRKEEW